MLEKILLYAENRESAKALAAWTLKLAKILNARIFAVFIINDSALTPQPAKTKIKRHRADSSREEAAWATLYEIEDDAFEENVKISLILEEGTPETKLIEVLQSFELNGIVVSGQSNLDFNELIRRTHDKVLIIK
jgi:hypothetical protein